MTYRELTVEAAQRREGSTSMSKKYELHPCLQTFLNIFESICKCRVAIVLLVVILHL